MKRTWSRGLSFALLFALALGLLPAAVPTAEAVSTDVVISQVYGGGGNTDAPYSHDFIELFNRGASMVSLQGWSIQYASSTGTGNFGANSGQLTELPNVSLQPGQYFLVQEASNANIGLALPTPDLIDSTPINMSGSAGKVALVTSTTGLGCNGGSTSCSAAQLSLIKDLVGYGGANFYEGAAAPVLTNTTAALRVANGCTDTDNNATDFSASAPAPRNSASPFNVCGGVTTVGLSINDVSQNEGNSGTTTFTFNVTLSAAAGAGGVTFDIASADNTATVADNDYVTKSLTGQTIPAGSSSYSFDVFINGDVTVELDETFLVNVTNVTGATIADGQGQGTIVNDDTPADQCAVTYTPIYSVQGSGATTPFSDQTVTVRGVVVGDFQTGLSGFNLQDATGDGNVSTSDGIFVFVPSANALSSVDVAVGDVVLVTGRAIEFNGLTEIDNVTTLATCGTATPPAATTVTLPETVDGELERYEGMLVSIPQTLTAQQNFFQGRYGQVTLGLGRLYGATNTYPAGSAQALAAADLNNRSLIVLDDAVSAQNPNPIPYIGEDNTLRAGDTVTGLTGVLDYGPINSNTAIRDYRLQPTAPVSFTRVNARTAAPEAVGGSLKVASFNVLNYFNGNGSGGGFPTSRGANTFDEFNRQRAKIIAALTAIDPAVAGLMEMENDGWGSLSAVQDLVNGLNTATAPGTYALVGEPAPGTDEIKVALIYQPAKVTPVGVAVNYQTSDPTYGAALFDRPPLAQTFQETATGATFTVIVNHFKSKGSCPASGPDTDQGDGQGCWNAKRVRQAQELLTFITARQSAVGDNDVLVIGDLNAYGMEDPIEVLTGAGLVNEISRFVGATAYSYVFDGLAGYLDHALTTTSLDSQVSGVTEWHINADEPSVIDYNTEFKPQDLYTTSPYRASDHDPVVVGLNLSAPTATAPTINIQPESQTINAGETAMLSVVASGTAPLSYQWYQGASGETGTPVGTNGDSFTTPALNATTSYWVRVSNGAGSVDSATATITVNQAVASTIILTALGSAYTQNFDTLANTAPSTTNNLTIPGWYLTESGGGARDNEQYAVDTGGSNTGDTYSYGTAGSQERALGGLRSGTLVPIFGAAFTNNTGSTIAALDVTYTGEEWRLGTASRIDQINFQYSTSANDLVAGAWTGVSALNFVTPDTTTVGAKDGNSASERTTLSATISGLNIPNGATFWIRWTDTDASLADDGLAVDDFSVTPQAAAAQPNLSISDVSLVEGNSGTTTFDFTVSLSAPAAAGGVTFDIATAENTATVADNDYAAKSLTGQTIPAGSTTYTFSVQVNGDTIQEQDETFLVNVTSVTGANVTDGQGQGTILNDDTEFCSQPFTPIYQIQGSGTSAAITGNVTTRGVVVGDFEGLASASGFYLQDLMGDANASTSDGIFVYTGSSNLVSVGDVVRVTGYARERFNQTALNGADNNNTAVTTANIINCGTGSVAPVDVTMPLADATHLERFEGMLVRFPQSLVIAEYFNYDRFGEMVLAWPLDGEPRPFTGTALDAPGAAANTRTLANSLRRITLDDANSAQNPTVLRHPNGQPFSLSNLFRGGDTVKNAVGVLGYDFNLYRIFPTGPAEYTVANPRPTLPEEVGGSIRVGAMNTLNFFVTADYPTGNQLDNKCGPLNNVECRGWDSDQGDEFTRQRTKLLAALSGLNADVIGLNELENTTGVEPLGSIVSGLPGYAYINTGTIGTDAIKVGMIYRPAVVTPVGAYKLLDSTVDPTFLDAKNRPSLAQTFEVSATGARFTIVVNHLKSKGSDCNDVGDPDTGDGQGNCNLTRTKAAQALVDWLATDPTGSGDPDFLIIGDLNSYAMEDPITTIKNAGYTNLIAQFQGQFAYSYTFDGQAGYLDHALANASLSAQVMGAADWHINSDEPDVLDYDTSFKPPAQDALYEPDAYRASDHDPVVVGLNLINEAPVADNDTYSTNEDSTLTVAAPGVLSNDRDSDSSSLTAVLVSGPSNGTLALDADGSFNYTPAADYNGADSFTYKASDGYGYSDQATVTVTVAPVNDAPVTYSQSATTAEDNAVSITLGASDVDGDSLTYSIVSGPTNGALSGSGASLTYTPNANFNGSDSFTFKVNDGTVDSNVATVSITVTAVNDAPTIVVVAGGSCGSTGASGTMNLSVLDPDGDSVSLGGTSSNTALVANNGIVIGGSADSRTVTITPIARKSGTALITLTASDGHGGSVSATIAVHVGTDKADTITGGNDSDLILGLGGDDKLTGGNGIDLLCGGAGSDTLDGGSGEDTLDGGAGTDGLSGGASDDILRGGDGNDQLTGGHGADSFSGGAGTDRATDFKASEGDVHDGTIETM